jgi:hypothetical protein
MMRTDWVIDEMRRDHGPPTRRNSLHHNLQCHRARNPPSRCVCKSHGEREHSFPRCPTLASQEVLSENVRPRAQGSPHLFRPQLDPDPIRHRSQEGARGNVFQGREREDPSVVLSLDWEIGNVGFCRGFGLVGLPDAVISAKGNGRPFSSSHFPATRSWIERQSYIRRDEPNLTVEDHIVAMCS